MLVSYDFRTDIALELKEQIQKGKKHTVYFGLHEGEPHTADHIGDILFETKKYHLHVVGHGISPGNFEYESVEDLISDILRINKQFNSRDRLWLETK